MFIVTDEPTFTHPVKVSVPVDGGHEQQDFKATFRVLATDKADKFDLSTDTGSTEFLKAIVVSMDDLIDAKKNPVPYSNKIRDKMLSWPFIRVALTKTYFAAIAKATAGN